MPSRLLVSAAVADRDQDRDALYDSAERRHDLAAELEGLVDDETVKARVIADTSQAHPAGDAAADGPGRPSRTRRSRGRSGQARSTVRRSERGR